MEDPHHIHPREEFVYLFWVLGPILVGLILFAGVKLMNYVDKRRTERDKSRTKNDDDV